MYALIPEWDSDSPDQTAPAPYNPTTWAQACNVLAGMPGLRHLRVHLSGNFLGNEYQFRRLLEPLFGIEPKEEYVVTCVGGPRVELQCAPFHLIQ